LPPPFPRVWKYPAAIAATTVLWCVVFVLSPFDLFLIRASWDSPFLWGIVVTNVGIALMIRGMLRRSTRRRALLLAPIWLLLGIAVAFELAMGFEALVDRNSTIGPGPTIAMLLFAPFFGVVCALLAAWYLLVPASIVATWMLWLAARGGAAADPKLVEMRAG
jgi:hypothetical protein